MLTKKQKEDVVEDLSKKFASEKIAIFTNLHGVSVSKLTVFRRELKKLGAEIKIAKKTLLKKAADAVGLNFEPKSLEGEIGVIFGYENQAETAKLTQKFKKENDTFGILAGFLEKKVISGKDVTALAKLPSREQLLGMLAGALVFPIQKFINVLQGNQRNLVVVLQKIKDKK